MLEIMSDQTHHQDDPILERWLHALAGIGEAVGGDEPVAQLLDRVARTACTLLGYDFCAVFLPDDARSALTIVGSHGLSGDYIAQVNADRPILLDVHGEQEAPTSIAFRTGEVVTLEDIELVPGFGWGGVAHEQGYRALISVPLAGPARSSVRSTVTAPGRTASMPPRSASSPRWRPRWPSHWGPRNCGPRSRPPSGNSAAPRRCTGC